MRRGNLPEAPNYTNAALVMGLVNLLWIFIVLWAVFGFYMVVAVGLGLNRLISWLRLRRA
ncbi:hypothetical protein [Roseovarius aestuariivivens]|uniref:hypothetical protein n=1 Tax=Roseovarius aestuariivivens TaxID=1888910 RepID=UPI00107FF7B2|nr:hypothetical protein [Roseovarius aestuariivivens]